jgi:hypothetical protein
MAAFARLAFLKSQSQAVKLSSRGFSVNNT